MTLANPKNDSERLRAIYTSEAMGRVPPNKLAGLQRLVMRSSFACRHNVLRYYNSNLIVPDARHRAGTFFDKHPSGGNTL